MKIPTHWPRPAWKSPTSGGKYFRLGWLNVKWKKSLSGKFAENSLIFATLLSIFGLFAYVVMTIYYMVQSHYSQVKNWAGTEHKETQYDLNDRLSLSLVNLPPSDQKPQIQAQHSHFICSNMFTWKFPTLVAKQVSVLLKAVLCFGQKETLITLCRLEMSDFLQNVTQ